ncbi:MAG: type I secretion system permease/ATPase [Paracoccaceae bacterium]
MQHPDQIAGVRELHEARRALRGLGLAAALFSAFVNLLMLTGPLFMLQVYDRVLSARALETLTALFLLVLFLFLMMGLLDGARNRLMARIAAQLQARLEARVFTAALRRGSALPGDPLAGTALRDLDAVQKFTASPTLIAFLDMPFTPLFLAVIFVFHPWLGLLALAGGVALVAVTLLNQRLTRQPLLLATQAQTRAERLADQLHGESELIQALGMRAASFTRWQRARDTASDTGLAASDLGAGFSVGTKTFRLFLQSAMLALGAWLVLRGELSAGAMIAASILMGRALAPVEQAISGWALLTRARNGWGRLAALLGATPPEAPRTALPHPRALLEVSQISIVPPGQKLPALRGLSFRLEPGQAMGVIGPSGAGKSTLARAICGVWPPAAGAIRLDGATLDQYDPDRRGQLIGYLPQRVTLFDGTIAENIARLSATPDPAAIVEAAKRAAAHQMILDLPEGYDTPVTQSGGRLSGGQIQRIGLARALYGDPVLLVLDEPNANLDNDGSLALNAAIRTMKAAGGAVLIMAHRPAAIAECDTLLVLEGGLCRTQGPRDQVMKSVLANAQDITRGPQGRIQPGGVA